jgi:hypothetical protein
VAAIGESLTLHDTMEHVSSKAIMADVVVLSPWKFEALLLAALSIVDGVFMLCQGLYAAFIERAMSWFAELCYAQKDGKVRLVVAAGLCHSLVIIR